MQQQQQQQQEQDYVANIGGKIFNIFQIEINQREVLNSQNLKNLNDSPVKTYKNSNKDQRIKNQNIKQQQKNHQITSILKNQSQQINQTYQQDDSQMQIGLDYQYKNSDVNETIQNETQNNKQNMKLIPTQLQHANDNKNNNNINNDKQHQVINIIYNNNKNEKKQSQNNDIINNNINNNIFGNNIDHKIINQTNKENYISQKQEEDSSKFNNISVDNNSNNISFNSGFLCMNIQLQCLILKEKLDIQYVQKEKKCKKCLQYKQQIKAIDEQIVQFKKCFLASSLHSLRTPLNISSNFLGVAKDMHEISQEIRENYLIPAYCSNEILSSAINDFQDYIMIDTKQFQLNIEEIDFNNLLKYVLMIFSPEQAIRNIPINVVIEASEKIIFNNDSQRITQIFINILQNAIRNCNGGEIKIQVQNQSQRVIVKVTDSGEIYDDKLQDSVYQDIFNERKTGQENEDDILRGNPLGLQISNKLAVELSKGKMLEIQTSKTFGNSIIFELYKFENSSDSQEKKLKNFQKQLSHANFNLVYQDWFQTDNGNISQDSINQISEVDEEQNSQTLKNSSEPKLKVQINSQNSDKQVSLKNIVKNKNSNGNLQKSKSSTATNFNQNNQMSSSYGGNNNQITIKMKEKKLARISTTITKNHKIIQRFNSEEMRNSYKNQKQYKSLLQEQNKHLQQLREMQMQKPKGNKNFINSQLNKVLKSIHESNNETSQGHHKPESSHLNSNVIDSQVSLLNSIEKNYIQQNSLKKNKKQTQLLFKNSNNNDINNNNFNFNKSDSSQSQSQNCKNDLDIEPPFNDSDSNFNNSFKQLNILKDSQYNISVPKISNNSLNNSKSRNSINQNQHQLQYQNQNGSKINLNNNLIGEKDANFSDRNLNYLGQQFNMQFNGCSVQNMHKFESSRSLQQRHNNYFIRRSGSNNYSKSNEYNQNDQEEYEPVIINPMHNKNYNHNNLKLESTLTKDSSKNYENSLKSNNNNQNTQIQKQQQQPYNLSASQIYANLKSCGKCTRILIVDDQAFNSLSQARKLEKKFKLKSDRALSGQEAIQKVHEKLQSDCCKVYQLIIMDVNMPPGKDGFQTSQEIYNILYGLKVHQKTKICIHTAIYAEQTNQFIQSKKSLICKFLKKPPTDNAFQEVLYDCLVNREEQI